MRGANGACDNDDGRGRICASATAFLYVVAPKAVALPAAFKRRKRAEGGDFHKARIGIGIADMRLMQTFSNIVRSRSILRANCVPYARAQPWMNCKNGCKKSQ